MKQILIKAGQAVVEEVPAPSVEPGTVIVHVDHSCISIGTELRGIRASGMPLWRRMVEQPEKVKRALHSLAVDGWARTRATVEAKLNAGTPTGYSAAGVVIAVGDGIDDIRPGDRVACGGAQCAYHAEVIRVPRNLTVPIPPEVALRDASTVTLGAIALQGVRRAQPTLGEAFVVVGLGILGQLTVQLLRANGCRVIGIDVDPERVHLATELGAHVGLSGADADDIDHVWRLTDGIGADGVIITAATPSDSVISRAFQMCRKKGRVVLVGDVGLHLNRADFYKKELDFLISTSYGPGRYDQRYEEQGLDYPLAYVRWTENRNMAAYLRLLAEGVVKVDALIGQVFPIAQAPEAYRILESGTPRPLLVLLSYPGREGVENEQVVRLAIHKPAKIRQVRIALVGGGGFAKSTHLPNLRSLANRYVLQAVVSRTGHNAIAIARQFGAAYATTDYKEVLADPAVDAVLIATRHDLHAQMTLDALRAGKHALVEKPLALQAGELKEIEAFYASLSDSKAPPVLLTGFNRRFSPAIRRIAEIVRERSNPMIINYRMNAGYIPLDHWVHGAEGGGRNLGEACHIYDLFTALTGSSVVDVTARPITPKTGYYSHSDNFVAVVRFADGSVCTLTYTALGSKAYPKEQMEVFVDGVVIVLNDYRRVSVWGSRSKGLATRRSEKGHREELEEFARVILDGGDWPIPLWQQIQATRIGLRVEQQLRAGASAAGRQVAGGEA